MAKINAVVIKPGHIPIPTEIDDDIVGLAKEVNIDSKGNPYKEFESFDIVEIKNGFNIISSPKGKERGLPITRTVGKYSHFYGIVYIVKMKGFDLVSMTKSEAIDYCLKFMNEKIPLESLE